ncbi:hypothetical protein OKA04_10940 [Luteolibacter flavescens]|uniref:DUF4381 domain-containing protein n=1 Tax=Luteolibacter flavescens TaxID=1859460 RepID=A0ABT3FNV2_9BACT|nr:hypothetical protein [Luteolibacter flavescens]MCW1885245.1 hypothetical protein [Luteolibacter flavescens]
MPSFDSAAISKLIIWMVAVTWPIGLLAAWIWRRRWLERYERQGEATSEEILDELEKAWATRRTLLIRTSTEYLPFVFERIREIVDSGFEDKQMLSLLERIDYHPPNEERQAVFPVEVKGRTVDLHLKWARDEGDRIRLRVTAAPAIIRALREQKKKIPKAAITD